MAAAVGEARATALVVVPPRQVVLRPPPSTTPGSPSSPTPATSRRRLLVRGEKPERWVRQTDFANDEAVGYLADRLARLGVEEALAEAGALPGDMVTIGVHTFDWEPSTPAGIAALGGHIRGTDARLDAVGRVDRPSAEERRAAKRDRRRHRDDAELGVPSWVDGGDPYVRDSGTTGETRE